jgi:hypothetical protein
MTEISKNTGLDLVILAEQLLSEIFSGRPTATEESDKLARALFVMIDTLTETTDETERESRAMAFKRAAFNRTASFRNSYKEFLRSNGIDRLADR